MQEHFGRHLPYLLAFEFRIPYQPRTTSEIQSYLTQTIIHWQAIAVSFDTSLVTQRFTQTIAQSNGSIFDGVMLVHFQVAFHLNSQVQASMLADLFQHMVKESQTGRNVTLSATIQIHLNIYIGLVGLATHFRYPFTGKKKLSYLVPIFRSQSTIFFQALVHQSGLVILQINGLTSQVLRQFHIRISVANHKTAGQIVFRIVQILAQHACAWLAGRSIVFRKTTVNEHFIKSDAFIFQSLHHQVMHRPESIFRKRRCTQAVLIGHHSKLKIQLATDKSQVTEHFRIEFQLFVCIKLVINRRFDDQCSVSIYKQNLFHSTSIFLKASNKASFSSFVPTVMRKQSLHNATFVRLRTIMPSLTR